MYVIVIDSEMGDNDSFTCEKRKIAQFYHNQFKKIHLIKRKKELVDGKNYCLFVFANE